MSFDPSSFRKLKTQLANVQSTGSNATNRPEGLTVDSKLRVD